MTRTLFEYNRREPNLRAAVIKEVLPSYFQQSYPNLIEFLETYYESIYNEERGSALGIIPSLISIRDLDEINLKYIDRLFYEIVGDTSSNYFNNPRLVGKLFSFIIQNTGNEYSAQLFFRTFFGEEPEVQYPKDNLFIVAHSLLNGTDLIQDGARYQILSVLIRSGRGISEWESLYRKLVHTSGYYLSAEVITEGVGCIFPLGIAAIGDNGSGTILYELDPGILIPSSGANEFTVQYDSDGTVFIQDYEVITPYSEITIENLYPQYSNISELLQATSPTFDDSDGPKLSNTIETMDNDKTLYSYNADSA